MSYILEALKKAEQQRELGQVPGIASDHEVYKTSVSKRWLWAALLAVNLVILCLLVLLWMRTDNAVPRRVDADPAAVAAAPALRSVSTSEGPDLPSALAPVADERVVVPVSRVDHVQASSMEDEWWSDTQPVDASGEALMEPEPEPEPELQPDVELPVWPRIPDYLLSQLTSGLRLDVHVYSPSEEGRFVLINLAKYREGDRLPEGPVLQEITPSGAILSLQGQRFRLQAQ